MQLSDLPELNWHKSPYLANSSTAEPFPVVFDHIVEAVSSYAV
jgi:hypothetical protein